MRVGSLYYLHLFTYIYLHTHTHTESDLFLLGVVITSMILDPCICLLFLMAVRAMLCTGAGSVSDQLCDLKLRVLCFGPRHLADISRVLKAAEIQQAE